MWVKPSSDPTRAVVIDPVTMQRIPLTGIEVPDISFQHLRMIDQGDLERFTPAPVSSGGSGQTSGGSSGAMVSAGGSVAYGGATGTVSSGGSVMSSGGSATSGGSVTSGS